MSNEEVVHILATKLDSPSLYMGGPSEKNKRIAAELIDQLAFRGYVIVDDDVLAAMGTHDPTGMDHLAEAQVAWQQRDQLLEVARNLFPYMPTGNEVHGQTMDTTMAMHAFREFRKVVHRVLVASQ